MPFCLYAVPSYRLTFHTINPEYRMLWDLCFEFVKFLFLVFLPGSPSFHDPFCFFFGFTIFVFFLSHRRLLFINYFLFCVEFEMHLLTQHTLHTQNSENQSIERWNEKIQSFSFRFYCFHSRLASTYYYSAHSIFNHLCFLFTFLLYLNTSKSERKANFSVRFQQSLITFNRNFRFGEPLSNIWYVWYLIDDCQLNTCTTV